MTYLNKSLVFQNLEELSDKNLQTKLWTASTGTEVSSFTEAVCQLFDDSGLDDALKQGIVFNDQIDNFLKKLGDAVDNVNSSMPPMDIINDEKFIIVRNLASEILKEIREIEE